jgi:Uma2 family endonuclease
MASNPISKLSEAEYLEIERAAEFRSEFIDGERFAMAGGTLRHALLLGNTYGELRSALRGTGCRALPCEFRVRISDRFSTYLDVSVICGKALLTDDHNDSYRNPTVVVEVLCPSSEKYDRGEKFRQYRTLESLKDYILVGQQRVQVEHFSRQPDNSWTMRDHQTLDEELRIDSIGVGIPLRSIYEGVELPSE